MSHHKTNLPVRLLEQNERPSGHWETVWRGTDGRLVRLVIPPENYNEATLARLRGWLERPGK